METNEKTFTVECYNCNGKGNLPYYQHRDGGICYVCDGEGNLGEAKCAVLRPTLRRKAADAVDLVVESVVEASAGGYEGPAARCVNPARVRDAAALLHALRHTETARDILNAALACDYTAVFYGADRASLAASAREAVGLIIAAGRA